MEKKVKDLLPEDLKHLKLCETCNPSRHMSTECPFYLAGRCFKYDFIELIENGALTIWELNGNEKVELLEEESE